MTIFRSLHMTLCLVNFAKPSENAVFFSADNFVYILYLNLLFLQPICVYHTEMFGSPVIIVALQGGVMNTRHFLFISYMSSL